jgi:uncharacterized protein (DUF2141 family)
MVLLLLSVICLAAGILFFLDNRSVPVEPEDPRDLASVAALPGYKKATPEQTSPESGFSTAKSDDRPSETAADEPTRSVAVRVKGLKSQASTLYVAIFDSAKGFPKPEHSRETTTVAVTTDSVDFSLSLPDLATAGIAIFQDLNGDGKLTKNGIGLPVEPYGFSNNARSTFGPPSFSQTAFEVSEKTSSMEIRVR